jgi:ABC-type transport system involved in multi-copper enzyme maturation permease subunit
VNIRTIAIGALRGFLHNKVILLFGSLFVCVVLLMMAPLMTYKSMTNAANAQQMQGFVLGTVSGVMSVVSGFGSLLAAWAAADSVAGEMKSGTVLAVMARPLRRWEFLAGKFLGVLTLMAIYVTAMLGITILLSWLGGQHIQTSIWPLLIYPLVRYAMWAALAILFVTLVHPVLVMGIILIMMALVEIFGSASNHIAPWIKVPVHLVLPLTGLVSEDRFMVISRASLKPFPWASHLVALSYAVDYALVCFLLAVFLFHRRELTRD